MFVYNVTPNHAVLRYKFLMYSLYNRLLRLPTPSYASFSFKVNRKNKEERENIIKNEKKPIQQRINMFYTE